MVEGDSKSRLQEEAVASSFDKMCAAKIHLYEKDKKKMSSFFFPVSFKYILPSPYFVFASIATPLPGSINAFIGNLTYHSDFYSILFELFLSR